MPEMGGVERPSSTSAVAKLPRLRGKQTPRGAWAAVVPDVAMDETSAMPPMPVTSRRRKGPSSPAPAMEQPPMKRPAGSDVQKRPAGVVASRHLCHGRGTERCVFSVQHCGARARYNEAASKQCPWCNQDQLQAAAARPHGRIKLSQALRFFWQGDKDIFHEACGRLPVDVRLYLPLQALGLPTSFHSQDAMARAFLTPRGKGGVLAALRKRQDQPAVVDEALKAIPAEHVEMLKQKLAAEPRRVRQARGADLYALSSMF